MPVVHVTNIIDSARISGLQKRVIVICVVLGLADGFNALSIGYAIPALSTKYGASAAAFSIVIVTALVGEILAHFLVSPLGDRFGRRRLVRIGIVTFGIAGIAAFFVGSVPALAVVRFFAGTGIGVAVANLFALGGEYAPSRIKATVITVLSMGVTSGGVIAGLIASFLVPAYGGPALLLTAGLIPLAVLLVTWRMLPESIAFLAKQGDQAQVRSLLSQIDTAREFSASDEYVGPTEVAGARVIALFRDGRALKTVTIWLLLFCGIFNAYFILSWLATLLTNAGVPQSSALLATALATLGGVVGGLSIGFLMDRTQAGVGMVALGSVVATLAVLLLVWNLSGHTNSGTAILFSAFLGFGVLGSSVASHAVATQAYPTPIRATGIGWAAGISRIGGLLAPALGGAMLAANYAAQSMLLLSLIPIALVAVFAITYRLLFGNVSGRQVSSEGTASTPVVTEAEVG